jgi:hypothetical protein
MAETKVRKICGIERMNEVLIGEPIIITDIWSATKFCYCLLGLYLFDSISVFLGPVFVF